MRPFSIGLIVGLAILALLVIVPRFLSAGDNSAAADAELARRYLHGYAPQLADLAARSEKGALESGAIARTLKENAALLSEAERTAAAAAQDADSTPTAGHVAGMVKLSKATLLLDDARRLRRSMEVQEGRVIQNASGWADVNRDMKASVELDVGPSVAALEADLERMRADQQQAQTEAESLAARIAETEKTIETVREEARQQTEQLRQLEKQSFQTGSDSSFQAYRAQYQQLSDRLRSLQEQEMLLAHGGVSGGQVVDDGLVESIEGGETVIGLSELKARHEIADERAKRLTGSIANVESQIANLKTLAASAKAEAERYRARLDEFGAEIEAGLARLSELYQQASEKDEQAARAAQEAVTAFRNAARKADAWQGAARQLQSAKDPQRANERLKTIVGDNGAKQELQSAEAHASALLGRVHAERAQALSDYGATLEQIAAYTGNARDTAELQTALAAAREAATTALNDAHKLYEQLAQSQSPTSWVLQASLAAVDHLLGQVDEMNRAQHIASAMNALTNALKGREQSPYVHPDLLTLRNRLSGETPPPPPPAPETTPAEEPAPEEDQAG